MQNARSIERSTLRLVWVVAAGSLGALHAQIDKPPAFDDKPAFQAGGAPGPDGASHVSTRGEQVSRALLQLLAKFERDTSGGERRQFQQGLALVDQRMAIAAVASFRQAAGRYPQSEPVACGLAVALYVAGEYDESVSVLLQHSERYPGHVALAPLLGEMAPASSALRPAAERRLRHFVREAPKSAAVRYYLAQLLTDGQPEAPQEAIALWTGAANLDQRDARPCLALGRAEAARNRPGAAVQWLSRGLQRDPNSAEAHYQLARLYFKMGRQDLAGEHMLRFRALRGMTSSSPTGRQ